jgi:hypothetical protein
MTKNLLIFFVLATCSLNASASFPVHELIEPIASAKTDSAIWGILSFVFGLLGIINPLFGIPATIFGAFGLKKKLRGLAIAGFILGLIEIIFIILVIVALFILVNNH